ncbi:excalibur calcium-binding domain-containing protein [Novosphingobium huizhouense]|uniref:excalibur calcium-binding domain-containing protein n=1 Tax=Novosphingobium huizhouense TaxID=2866625 RepID=UPI001CD86974|nr:excalibur calcium-binding domain-containing protein [Novosphingobium huizhouense]
MNRRAFVAGFLGMALSATISTAQAKGRKSGATGNSRRRAHGGAAGGPRGGGDDAYYPNCSSARAAGAAPIRAGDPGYSRKLDRDGDGIACE